MVESNDCFYLKQWQKMHKISLRPAMINNYQYLTDVQGVRSPLWAQIQFL